MVMWVKKNATNWVDVKKMWVKKNSTSWTSVKKIWVKNTPTVWSQFWPEAGPYPDEDLELTTSTTTYLSQGTSYPKLTAKVYHYFSDGALTLRYKWSAGPTNSGPWTEFIGYSTYQTYSPGNPSLNSFNTLSITPELYEYVSGRTYFKFTMQSVDSSGVSTREVVSEPIYIGSPYWHQTATFSGISSPGYTFKWDTGIGRFQGSSNNIGYMTTIYRTNDNGVTKQYVIGTSTTPEYSFSDNTEYSFTPLLADAGYTYYASTYSVYGDSEGPLENALPSTTISGTKKVSSPPGSFSITSFVKNKITGNLVNGSRTLTLSYSASTDATKYEFKIERSIDNITWYSFADYFSQTNATTPTTNITVTDNNTGSYRYYRATMRATNDTTLYTTSTNTNVSAVGTAPGAPTINSGTVSFGTVTLNYTETTNVGSGTGIDAHDYAYKLSTDTNYSSWIYTGSSGGSLAISGLTAGYTYDFKLRSYNDDNIVGPESNSISVRIPVQPGSLTARDIKTFTSGQVTVGFTTGSNTTGVYYFATNGPYVGSSQFVKQIDGLFSGLSSNTFYTLTIPDFPTVDDQYDIILYAQNEDVFGDSVGPDIQIGTGIYPDGSDNPTSTTPTFSSITGTGFEANFALSGSVNNVILDIKTGGSSISGFPQTISASSGANTYTATNLSDSTSYTFFVTPQYKNSTYTSFTHNGVQKSASTSTNYVFSMGKSLYVSTNGYIGLTSGSSQYTAIPLFGYNILVHLADFVQRQVSGGDGSGQLFRWSNSTQYSLRWNGYLRGFENNGNYRVTYQINFYTDQQYYDIKYVHVGSSVYATDRSDIVPGLYIDGALKAAGTTSPFPWLISSGTTYRVYYNGSATTSGIAFTEIAQADMVDVGAVTNGSSDDGYTSITTAIDQYTLPTISIGTITEGVTSEGAPTFSIPLTGTFAKYDYNIRTVSHTGTSVASGTNQTGTPRSITTGLQYGTTYYISFTPKNTFNQTGTVQQTTKTTSNLYTITFDSQSGSAVAALTQATVGGSIAKPTDPTRTNHVFNGWFTASTGGTAVTWPRTPTANETLYAQWTYLSLVTYDKNGGGGTAPTAERQTTAGGSITLPGIGSMTAPAGKNTFSGWVTTTGGTSALSSPYTPTADVTLYAYWTNTVTYSVTYNGNGSTGGSVPSDTNTYAQGATVTVKSNSGSLTKTGSSFSQWNTKADGTGNNYAASGSVTFTMGTANVILYAVWVTLPTTTAVGVRDYNQFGVTISLPSGTGSVVIVYGTSTSYGSTMGTYTTAGTKSPVGPLLPNFTYYFKATPWSGTSGNGIEGTAVTGSVTTYVNPAHTAATPVTPTFQRFTSGNNSYIRYGWNNQSNLTPTGDYASWGYQFQIFSNPGLTTTYSGPFYRNFIASGFDSRLINTNERIYVFSGEGSATPYIGEFAYTTSAVYGRYRAWYIPHGSSSRVFSTNFSAAI